MVQEEWWKSLTPPCSVVYFFDRYIDIMKTPRVKYWICVLFSCIICSCTQENDKFLMWDQAFGKLRKIESSTLLNDELIMGQPFLIQYVDSSLVIFDNIGDSLFIMIDMLNNNKIYRFGQKGEGDNEFLQVFSFAKMVENNTLGVYDMYRHVLRKVDLDELRMGKEDYPIIARDTVGSIKLFKTSEGNNLGLGFYEDNFLSLTSGLGNINYFFEYPYQNKREKAIPNRLRGMAYQGTFCSNNSLNRFLYTVQHAPIFMMFSVDDSAIKKTYEFVAGYPIYKTEETEAWSSAPISADCEYAFLASYATDNYIYLLYSGKSFREYEMKAFQGDIIYQLTWDGIPVSKFKLDFPAMNFCVSDNDKMLYALVNKGETEIVWYNLK